MNAEAKEDIMDDTILDAAHDCQDCANSRLIDRQRERIGSLLAQLETMNARATLDAKSYERDQYLIAALREQLKAYGFQVEALREELRGVIRGER